MQCQQGRLSALRRYQEVAKGPKPGLLQKVINYPINLYRKVSDGGPQSDWRLTEAVNAYHVRVAEVQGIRSGFGVTNYHIQVLCSATRR